MFRDSIVHQVSSWSEQEAEEVADLLGEKKSLPDTVEVEMSHYLDQDEPMEALEVFLKSRAQEVKASD